MPEPSEEQAAFNAERSRLFRIAQERSEGLAESEGMDLEIPLEDNAVFLYLVWRGERGKKRGIASDDFLADLLSNSLMTCRAAAEAVMAHWLERRRRKEDFFGGSEAISATHWLAAIYAATGWAWGCPACGSRATRPRGRPWPSMATTPSSRPARWGTSIRIIIVWFSLCMVWEWWARGLNRNARLRWASNRALDEFYPGGSSAGNAAALSLRFVTALALGFATMLGGVLFVFTADLAGRAEWFCSPPSVWMATMWGGFAQVYLLCAIQATLWRSVIQEGRGDPVGHLAAKLDQWRGERVERMGAKS